MLLTVAPASDLGLCEITLRLFKVIDSKHGAELLFWLLLSVSAL